MTTPSRTALSADSTERAVIGDQPAVPGAVEAASTWLFERYLARAQEMVQEGYATGPDIDAAMRGACRLRRGPVELQAERAGRRPAEAPGGSRSETGRAPASIGVAGSGTMGAGIAEVFARAGLPVTVAARSAASGARLSDTLNRTTARGFAPAQEKLAVRERITVTTGPAALGECDLVIECVSEDLAIKSAVFEELDRYCRPATVLATTTSSLSVSALAARTRRPSSVVGMHFFNPAPVMACVELVATAASSAEATATATGAVKMLGKKPVWCADRPGFIVNRLLMPYLNDAVRVLAGGISAEEIDVRVKLAHGFPTGPLQLVDLIGVDVVLAIQRSLHAAFGGADLEPAPLLSDLVRDRILGAKNGTSIRTLSGGQ